MLMAGTCPPNAHLYQSGAEQSCPDKHPDAKVLSAQSVQNPTNLSVRIPMLHAAWQVKKEWQNA